ncbi:MAG: hypothetical protein Q9225_006098, partial [Loekoesia sp. 1 TL-2023]
MTLDSENNHPKQTVASSAESAVDLLESKSALAERGESLACSRSGTNSRRESGSHTVDQVSAFNLLDAGKESTERINDKVNGPTAAGSASNRPSSHEQSMRPEPANKTGVEPIAGLKPLNNATTVSPLQRGSIDLNDSDRPEESSSLRDSTWASNRRSVKSTQKSPRALSSAEQRVPQLPVFETTLFMKFLLITGIWRLALIADFVAPVPPIPPGKIRIEWTCICGSQLYDDFFETRPGAAAELMTVLHVPSQQRPSCQLTSSNYSNPNQPSSMNYTGGSVSALEGQSSSNVGMSGIPYDPRPINGRPASTTVTCGPESKWLLVCAQAWQRPTSLLHLNVCSTSSDQQLFTELRQLFVQLKKAWWHNLSLKVVKSIRFVQFELHPKDLVDIRKVPDMPSETRKEEYLYQPCDLLPPVGENLMTHLFHHPHEANEKAITFLRSPKKLKQRLAVCPRMGTNVGWGIHLVEGWAITKVWLLALVIFV